VHARTHTHTLDRNSLDERSVRRTATSILNYITITRKNIPHAPGGIRTHHVSNQMAAGPHLRHHNHRNQLLQIQHFNIFVCVAKYSFYFHRKPRSCILLLFFIFKLCELLLPHVMMLKCVHINHQRISSVTPFIFMYSFWNKQKFRAP
jgi:hypothetical protein